MSVPQVAEPGLESQIGHLAGVICSEHFSNGERAALRRMTPGQAPPLSFYRFALAHLPSSWELLVDDWVTLVAGIAIMSPNAHRIDCGVGKALAEARYSESRLERLLATDGDTRRTLVLRAARLLAAKASPCNWLDFAQLLLIKDDEKREALNRRIAKDFFQNIETR